MRIIWQEMKKIFNPVMLLILVLINMLMYYIFIDFDISVFPNGRPATDHYHIGIEMVEKYGHELDEIELKDFKEVLQQEIKKADEYIQSDKEFAELGITTYEESREMNIDMDKNPAYSQLHSKIVFDKGVDFFWEIPAREDIIEDFEYIKERYGYGYIEQPTEDQERRIQEVVNTGAVNSIFPAYPVEDNFHSISKNITITILVSVLFMISPIFIRDYKNNMIGLQYTSKAGRSLFKKKVAAGVLSAFLITTILLVVYYSMYATNDIGMFLASGINSFMGTVYWYDFTFLQLIIVTIGLTYVLSLSLSLVAIYVSSICKNYIAIIGFQLPIFVLVCVLIFNKSLLSEAFLINSSQLKVAVLYCVIIISPIILLIWKKRREKNQDILFE
ncbi:ABC transporter permease [Cytobacillus dafuensis]|uniref:ABC transporter permease n=1 Tax=Cytobacillus dafuensis TaxID=1742359 RepID=A0A5B8Z4S5_CYTDA|nr:ABC transporter permease [Cytobacillus dafuensis]QED46639.1 ABC transporter permease [Cytobacillus dafuensis]